MSETAISIDGLSKAYRIGLKEEIPDTLFAAARGLARAPLRNWRRLRSLNTFGRGSESDSPDLYWALKDVSFDVQEGEVVGIIGRNGAGKSTLLKVLSRITEPTRGEVRIRGRVSSLLEVGTGFHPELSGRDNIYMNGTILGMSKREIDRKFDQIVDFSGVETFLDTPVKRYSSGMKVRLAFSVAAHLEPEVLIIDEVLAVGDAEFQQKCLGKMQDVAGSGRTVLFVSHNMAAVESLCSHAILLSRGSMAAAGNVSQIIDSYVSRASTAVVDVDLRNHDGRPEGLQSVFQQLRLLDETGSVLKSIRAGGDAVLEFVISCPKQLLGARFIIDVEGLRGERLFQLSSHHQHREYLNIAGDHIIRIHIRNFRLAPGRYIFRPRLKCDRKVVDTIQEGLFFEVSAADVFGTGRMPDSSAGAYLPEVRWEVFQNQCVVSDASVTSEQA